MNYHSLSILVVILWFAICINGDIDSGSSENIDLQDAEPRDPSDMKLENEKKCPVMVEDGDHLLIEYEYFQDGFLIENPRIMRPKPYFHFIFNQNEIGEKIYYNLLGSCENTTSTIILWNYNDRMLMS